MAVSRNGCATGLQIRLREYLADLNGVGGCALADIIRNDPQIDAVRNGFVPADTSDQRQILSGSVRR
jgi:hypothetical protein